MQLIEDVGGGATLAITGDACHGTPSACTTNDVTNGFTSVYSSGPTGNFQPLVMSIPPRRFSITNLSRSTPFSGGAPATVTPVVFEGLVGLISWETPTSGTLTGGTYKLSIRVAAFASAADAGYGFPDPGMGNDPGYAAFALTGAGTTIADWRLTLTPYDCGSADFDGDGDTGTDADIEAYFACLGRQLLCDLRHR